MTEEKPFQAIQEHNSILQDLREMQDNLGRLEDQVRMAKHMELGGRGMYDPEMCIRICDGTRDAMDYIKADIQELDPYNGEYRE